MFRTFSLYKFWESLEFLGPNKVLWAKWNYIIPTSYQLWKWKFGSILRQNIFALLCSWSFPLRTEFVKRVWNLFRCLGGKIGTGGNFAKDRLSWTKVQLSNLYRSAHHFSNLKIQRISKTLLRGKNSDVFFTLFILFYFKPKMDD